MDITATNGSFYTAMMRIGDWEAEWNKKDGSLSVWGGKRGAVNVTTYRGEFIEALDEGGNIVCEGGDGDWFYVPVTKKKTKLRFKKLPDPALSKADINKARQSVTRYVVSDKPYSLEIPDTLPEVIKWMQKHLDSIPKASRAKASFRFDTTMEYGETYPQIEITYSEPETDAEVILRVQIERERARISELKDRAKLKQLQEKLAIQ